MRGAIQRALTGAGYIVHTAIEGEAAIGAVRQTQPDVVVLDLALSKISGVEILRALKQDALTKSIPVIVLAELLEISRENLFDEGAAACVVKSDTLFEANSAVLLHTVAQVAGKTRASST